MTSPDTRAGPTDPTNPGDTTSRPLIVGAGPVGLAAALFLRTGGGSTRVIEQRLVRSEHSRALAVNPRTLELLKPTGVTERMLELGQRIRGARLHKKGKVVVAVDFHNSHPEFPFMLALSQATTEHLLEAALIAGGGAVERGTRLAHLRIENDAAQVTLERSAVDSETVRPTWVLAADGARSSAREQLQLAFDGSTMSSSWHLADAPLQTALEPDCAHVFLQPGGAFLFLIRVITGDRATDERNIWRVLGNRPDPLSRLEAATAAESPIWASTFDVPHRLISSFKTANVCFAGDAAHVHSPVGARGMNLGIEDAWVFATLARGGQLARYASLRRKVDRRVVRRVSLLSHVVATDPSPLRMIRALLPLAAGLPPVRKRLGQTIMGLDHALTL